MIIDQSTDLTQFAGKRVVVNHFDRRARIQTIRHDHEYDNPRLSGGFGGMCVEDPHGDCRGGSTAFWWPYGTDLTIEELP